MAFFPRNGALAVREAATDSNSFTVTIDCALGNEYDGRLGLRISAIFVIFLGSMLGCLAPLLLSLSSATFASKKIFFAAKFFGSGVIIATAFIHLLAPAIAALYSPCLDQDSPITTYAWPEGICLMSVFIMFLLELMVNHIVTKPSQARTSAPLSAPGSAPGTFRDTANECHSQLDEESLVKEPFAVQLTSLCLLEFGVIFHSVLIGLTLGVAGEELVVLYIVLTFHQTFEGLGLGARLSLIPWPKGKALWPYFLSAGYSLSTPVAIAIGIGVRRSFAPGSHRAMVISGVFDSVSAGILLYTGLVQLVAYDFFYSPGRPSKLVEKLTAFGWVSLGAALMALLGNWA